MTSCEDEIDSIIQDFLENESETFLDINGLDIVEVPLRIFEDDVTKRVCHLSMDYNEIQCIPASIHQLKYLTSLSLLGNSLSELPEELTELNLLETLSFNENELTRLPSNIGILKQLRHLSLVSNQLEFLPDSFGGLESLEELYLDENQLTILPNSICNIRTLRIVEVASNKVNILPNDFGTCENIEILNLSSNELKELPNGFKEFKKLKILDISNNKITSLPDEFQSCWTLEKFYLESNVVSYFPEWVSNLPNLEEINISDNTLSGEQITSKFCATSTLLKKLESCSNFLSNLPENFGDLKKLEYIHFGSMYDELERSTFINGNWLRNLPESFSELINLTKVNLDENQIEKLPERFGQLENLEWLDLGQNMLECLPESFCRLTKLEFLQLSKNKLTELPEDFGNLISLIDLRLDHNHLSTIPESLRQLSSLQSLDLFGNKLTELPTAILGLKKINRLDLDGNLFQLKLSEIPRRLPGTSYPSRDPNLKDNWRGRTRADKVKITSKIIDAGENYSDSDEVGEEEIEWNESALRAAIKHGASFWRSHTGPASRDETDKLKETQPTENKLIDDDEWQALTFNVTRSLHIGKPVPKTNPDEEDWDEEIEQTLRYNETMETCNNRKNQTSNLINDFQNTINRYPPAAQAFSKTANYESFVYRKVEPVIRMGKQQYQPLPGQFDDVD